MSQKIEMLRRPICKRNLNFTLLLYFYDVRPVLCIRLLRYNKLGRNLYYLIRLQIKHAFRFWSAWRSWRQWMSSPRICFSGHNLKRSLYAYIKDQVSFCFIFQDNSSFKLWRLLILNRPMVESKLKLRVKTFLSINSKDRGNSLSK